MKRILLLPVLIFIFLLSSCTTQTTTTTTNEGNTETTTTTTTTVETPTNPTTNDNREEIGDANVTGTNPEESLRNILKESFSGVNATVDVENTGLTAEVTPAGDVYYPENSDMLPLVLIAHGSYEYGENTEYHKGFEYLANAVANQGAFVVTMNLQPTFNEEFGPEIKDGYKFLKVLPVYIDELNTKFLGKFDTDKVYIIGHSNMGAAAIDAGREFEYIKGVIALSPIEIENVENLLDVPIISIDGTLDGLIQNRAGFLNTKRIRDNYPDRLSDLSYILMDNFNHYQFNSMLDRNDTEEFLNEEKVLKLVEPEVQREATSKLVAIFMDNMHKGKHTTEGLDLNKGEISDVKYKSVDYRSSDISLYVPNNESGIRTTDSKVNSLGYEDGSGYISADEVIFPVSIYEMDIPNYVRVDVDTSGSIEIPLNLNHVNENNGKDIIVEIAQNSGDKRNNYKDGTVTAIIKYPGGGTKTIEFVTGTASLRYVEGKLEDVDTDPEMGKLYSEFTIPTDLYITLDEGGAESITLEFNESASYIIGEIRTRGVGD